MIDLLLVLSSMSTRVVLIFGIFEFLPWQRLIWFEINKKKKKIHPTYSQFYVPHSEASFSFKWHGVFGTEISIFYSGQSNCSKNLKLSRIYSYNSSYPSKFLQIFSYYNFGVYNLLTLRYSSILSSCNSKIIIAKNL